MKSTKFTLIWLDIKSWLVTTSLMLLPIVIGQAIVFLQGKDLGQFTAVILLALGALLKLAQKWADSKTYTI